MRGIVSGRKGVRATAVMAVLEETAVLADKEDLVMESRRIRAVVSMVKNVPAVDMEVTAVMAEEVVTEVRVFPEAKKD
jgi:hypothetical protein